MATTRRLSGLFLMAIAGLTTPVFAQDSVSTTPGTPDVLEPGEERAFTNYVVDLVPLTSSWNRSYLIGPVLKANADSDPLFTTQILGSAAISPDHVTPVAFAPTSYEFWTVAGQGISLNWNAAPGTLMTSGFTRQFGVAFSDLAPSATHAVGATIGQDASNLARVWVSRRQAASSRDFVGGVTSSTPSLGAIDARGNLFLRVDDFNATAEKVLGENIVRVNVPGRTFDGPNRLFNIGAGNTSSDPGAVTYLINNGAVTVNTPGVLPATGVTPAVALILDFANAYRANGGGSVSSHLAIGSTAHRGNPSFSSVNTLGGVGTVASLARPAALVNAINLFAVNQSGGVVGTRNLTLPVNITDGAGFTTNAAGTAEFLQYLSQTTFRGGNGQVGVGLEPGSGALVAAATATDPVHGDFVAVARVIGGTTTWTVAAFEGKQVLNGPSGTSIGTIANVAPVSLSSPAVDLFGNVYFVAAFQPTAGPLGTALIKAVNTVSGYRLEAVLRSGQVFTGANSTRQYTIERLTLGDSDSIASGSFFAHNLLQATVPGVTVPGADSPLAMGGAIVNASIVYNNNNVNERYQAVLFISPAAAPPPFCVGNANGDSTVSFADITSVLTNFGATYTPGSAGAGDANNDGSVNFADITAVLTNFGATCP